MKRLAVVAVLVAGCAPASAEYRFGKMASDPYIKVDTSSRVEHRPVLEPEPEPAPPETTTTTVAPRDLLAECRTTVAELLPTHPPAPGWADPVCHAPDPAFEAEQGRRYAGYVIWRERTVHLTPTDQRINLRYLYLHEAGHTWCVNDHYDVGRFDGAYDYDRAFSEECADEWARAAA